MIYLAKATQLQLLSGLTSPQRWSQLTERSIVANYPSGPALITGPIEFGTPQNAWQEINCAPEVLPEIEARATLVAPMMAQVRGSGLLRAVLQAEGRATIRNSSNQPVAPMPAIVIVGRAPVAEMLGNEAEDLDALPVLSDLE